jgi:hypothetical protein
MLFTLFDREDVARIELQMSPEIYTARDPEPHRAWLSNAIRIYVGARPALVERRLMSSSAIDAVIAAMQARMARPEGVALFHWDRLTAWKKED